VQQTPVYELTGFVLSQQPHQQQKHIFIRTIPVWNQLPDCTVNAQHVLSFKEQATPIITWM